MKNFGDLKRYIQSHSDSVYCLMKNVDKTICIQVYASEYAQANIQINGNAVIKFEERSNDVFAVAICENNDPDYIIQYSRIQKYSIQDDLVSLLENFSDSDYIRDIVGALLVN